MSGLLAALERGPAPRRGLISDLLAPMNVAAGEVLTKDRTAKNVLRFFKQIDALSPRGLSVHVAFDDLSAHKGPRDSEVARAQGPS